MRAALSAGAALLLAACAPTADDTCAADDYGTLLGANIAAVTLPADPDIRVFAEGDAVTQDFRTERTNIVYDQTGEIIRIFCG